MSADAEDSRPLIIIVVGAGLVGFAAAVALRREGHCVTIYETSSFKTELGAGLAVPPNTLRCLLGLGCTVANLSPVDNLCFTSMAYDGTAGMKSDSTDYEGHFGLPWIMVHRVDLHTELRRLALDSEGMGPPARLHLSHRVVSCDVDACAITLADGSVQGADVIIGADGIRSTIRAFVLGEDIPIPPSHTAGFRWLTHASDLDPYPELDWIVKTPPLGARLISAPIVPGKAGTKVDHRTIVIYACRGGRLVNVLGIHEDLRDQDSVAWNAPVTQEALLDFFADYHPRFRRLLELAKDVHIWQMRVVPPLQTWVNRRVCLMGDAAHASLPTLGQGFGMGLEDAVALGALLPKATPVSRVESRLVAYEKLRKERAEFVAKESFEQQHVPAKRGLYLRSTEMREQIMGYDVKEEAERVLRHLMAQK
ncbi:FAD/NAD(P)-binding domain-containing protein [Mycena albidolilacea]|uniref:FAD/NAD(P)-binding domain-containing protein n=1 Tax=Mycena albidolilacea TaxID=1033008 RepID=A0AAD6YWZ4_9AGAR|nr:FAD/NAD(P)-binding domain-containing protein [Mycena albidolilacea]